MVRCITCNVWHLRQFCRFLYCLAWFHTVEFNRLPCSNNKICDDADFAARFRYQLDMFGIRVLIWLSWLLHAHIAYITDGAMIIAAFCRISYCLHDLIRLDSIVGYVQNNDMYDDMVFNDRFWYQLTMFEVCIFTGLSRLLCTHIAYEISI